MGASSARSLVVMLLVRVVGVVGAMGGTAGADAAAQRCAGAYAEDLSSLSPAARELEVAISLPRCSPCTDMIVR